MAEALASAYKQYAEELRQRLTDGATISKQPSTGDPSAAASTAPSQDATNSGATRPRHSPCIEVEVENEDLTTGDDSVSELRHAHAKVQSLVDELVLQADDDPEVKARADRLFGADGLKGAQAMLSGSQVMLGEQFPVHDVKNIEAYLGIIRDRAEALQKEAEEERQERIAGDGQSGADEQCEDRS